MKTRFQPNRLTPWRQRFVAIAREQDSDPARRREAGGAESARGPKTVRDVRLGSVRTA